MRRFWTEDEIKKLRDLYPDTIGYELSEIFNRKINAIYHKAKQLGLKKSKSFFASEKSGRLIGKIGISTRFQKGQSGWNKGLKQTEYMSAENIEKSASGRFKKGNVPKNYKPIGHESITVDGYVQIKVRDAEDHTRNFELKHRWIWENENGPIPKDMVIEFADGNKSNFALENLILRTRKENILNNMLRDEAIVKKQLGVKNPEIIEKIITEMPGVIELKRKSIILNRKINAQGKN